MYQKFSNRVGFIVKPAGLITPKAPNSKFFQNPKEIIDLIKVEFGYLGSQTSPSLLLYNILQI
jgi:hypothetical protein